MSHFRRLTAAVPLLLLLGLFACLAGCAVHGVRWRSPIYERAKCTRLTINFEQPCLHRQRSVAKKVEELYRLAREAEADCRPECVDLYFQVAASTECQACESCGVCRRCRLHRSALYKLVVTGEHYGRLDPSRGLQVCLDGQQHFIPIRYDGFVWEPNEFGKLIPVGRYHTRRLHRRHCRSGAGVPLVVQRCPLAGRRFLPDRVFFAATLLLDRPADGSTENLAATEGSPAWSLRLCDPFRIDTVEVNGYCRRIAKDTTAPIAYRLSVVDSNPWASFLFPSTEGEQRLAMLEPYQPGKIPIILVHGLLSNPYAWADMVNDLSSQEWVVRHFQIWVYQYPTGEAFLRSAAGLREQLQVLRNQLDPKRRDPALERMVLIGHSMGGLIAKLQVTCSGDRLWHAIANRPLNQLEMNEDLREDLKRAFFFQPSPDIERVVYIGTPHRGSGLARRILGRLGSAIVQRPDDREAEYESLLAANPNVFSDEMTRRIPTSIDLLDPDSCLLQAMAELPMRDSVSVHSIIGDSCWSPLSGWSDGVVPLSSAREPRAITEKIVTQKHTKLHRHPESIREVLAILRRHLAQCHPSRIPIASGSDQNALSRGSNR